MSFISLRSSPFASPRHAPWALAIAVALTAPGVARAQPAVSPSGATERADALYRQGNEAFKKGDFEGARTAYREAYTLRPSFDIAANLGAVEMQLGAHRDAAEHLAASLRVAPVSGSADAKARTAGLLRDAKARVATLAVSTSEPGAEVEVDGKPLGRSPFAHEVFVEPGVRVFTASLPGKSARLELELTAGSTRELTLVLAEVTAPPGATPPVPSNEPTTRPPDEERRGPPLWPGFVLGGVGVVGVGVGIGMLVKAGNSASSADAAAARLREAGQTCSAAEPSSGPIDCAVIDTNLRDADPFRTGGTIALGVGGVALAGGVIYLVWAATQSPSEEGSITSSIQPWSGPGLLGTGFQGAF
jgi:hypothetical protein